MEQQEIKFSDLHWLLKVATIGGIVYACHLVISFVIGYLFGMGY